jgi:hypothetical protein
MNKPRTISPRQEVDDDIVHRIAETKPGQTCSIMESGGLPGWPRINVLVRFFARGHGRGDSGMAIV